jgi:hypothetical protein
LACTEAFARVGRAKQMIGQIRDRVVMQIRAAIGRR